VPDVTTTVAPARAGRGHAATVARWALQVGLAAVFAGAGASKLVGTPEMVDLFADVGAGEWLRYLVGAAEVAGAVGLLVPRLARLAALGLAALMLGATVTNLVVLDADPTLPIVLLLAAAAVVVVRTRRTTGHTRGSL